MAFDDFVQQNQAQQQGGSTTDGGGFDSFMQNQPSNTTNLPSSFTEPPVSNYQTMQSMLQPTSSWDAATQAVKDNPSDLVTGLRESGTFLSNAAKDVGSGVMGLGNAILHPVTTVENMPKAIIKTGAGVGDWLNQLVNDPGAAMSSLGNTVYEKPVTSLLNAVGIGDGVGAALKAAGSIGESGALAAAKTAAGLTGDEAATATLGGTNALTSLGEQISNGSNAINPANLALKGATAIKDVAGNGIAKTLGFATQTSAKGTSAIQDIANGNIDKLQGMRLTPKTDQANAFNSAVNTIDNANAQNGGGALFNMQDILHGTQPAGAGAGAIDGALATPSVAETLANSGLKLNVMSPGDQATVLADLNKGVISPDSDAIFNKYYPNAVDGVPPAINTSGKVSTKFLSSKWVPELPAQKKADILSETLSKNGLIGVKNGPMLLSSNDLGRVMDVVKQMYKLGGTDEGFEPNATNLNNVKRAAQSLYQPDSPLMPASNSQKMVNIISKKLADTAQHPLNQFPSYNSAMKSYQDYYDGTVLNPLTGPTINSALGKGAGVAELLATLAASHFISPVTGAGFAATSPRIVGEAANMYGKAARGFGAITAPAKNVASSGALSSLLQLLTQQSQ